MFIFLFLGLLQGRAQNWRKYYASTKTRRCVQRNVQTEIKIIDISTECLIISASAESDKLAII